MQKIWRPWRPLWWTMTRYSNMVLSMLLWVWGGTVYFLMEVAWKTFRGRPETISWLMLIVAFLLCIPIERCGAELPWNIPIWLQALICGVLVTLVELLSGLILNVKLDLNIWDYSDLWGNFMGQICPQFSLLWFALCLIFIPVFDHLRYAVQGGEKPRYYLFFTD